MKAGHREIVDRVEFRWRQHEEHFAKLLAESARENGRSESEQARELLKTALGGGDEILHGMESLHKEIAQLRAQLRELAPIKAGLRTIHENVYQLRDDLAQCVAKVLADAGSLDSETAEEWVKQALNAQ
jgi:hypothetical protein